MTVDHMRGAGGARMVSALPASRRADDTRAGGGGDLHGHVADGPRGPVDEDRQARDRPVGMDGAMRRHRRHAETGARRKVEFIGQVDRLRGGKRDQLGGAAERPACLAITALRVPQPHPFADPHPVDARPDIDDLAGAVGMGDDERMLHRHAAPAGATLDVGRVDAGGAHAHQHLARPGSRVGAFADFEHLGGRARAGVEGGAHQAVSPGAAAPASS
jgi:hypothetical protein